MKYHYKSHHIFTFLGILILIFIIFFGAHYFQSIYTFENTFIESNTQNYEEGIDTTNPFFPHPDDLVEQDTARWIRFGSTTLSFLYPEYYALQIMNENHINIIPPLLKKERIGDCNQYVDEQQRARCLKPYMSPNIVVEVVPLENDLVAQEDITIAGQVWNRTSYQDEFGGSVWYRKNIHNNIIQVSYTYHDSPGGISFDALHTQYGNQYQLSASEQDKLVLAVLKSIKYK